VAGASVFLILKGKKARPVSWIFTASKRQKAVEQAARATAWRTKLLAVERAELGHDPYESWGRNWGPRVYRYQQATGAYRAPWCVSFQQWALMVTGYGRIADRSAGVFYAVQWARARGWLRSTAAPGRIVAYMGGSGHMGMIERVYRGGYTSLEDNH
jgi:hypothetical protein